MWTLCPENIDEIQQPSHVAKWITYYPRATVFFNEAGIHTFDILPQNQEMDTE
jgi:hypothetical protein